MLVENRNRRARSGNLDQELRRRRNSPGSGNAFRGKDLNLGGGLEKGAPCMEAARKAQNKFLRDEQFEQVAALDAAICGGAWHHGRHDQTRICHRCGSEDSAWHAYRACPQLPSHGSEEVKKSNWLKDRYENDWAWAQCLWGRALIPIGIGRYQIASHLGEPTEQVVSDKVFEAAASATKIFTDGSGGPAYAPREAKQCGSAVGIVHVSNDDAHAKAMAAEVAAGSFSGRQTVPRAELWAGICWHACFDNTRRSKFRKTVHNYVRLDILRQWCNKGVR